MNRPTTRQLAALPFTAAIRAYQLTLGQLIGGRCRFHPSCSHYALIAFREHPPHRAAWLAARRLARCHPWGGHGIDPVPPPKSRPQNPRRRAPDPCSPGRS